MNKILIVVDMQNDFITGSLGTPEARSIVPKVVEKVKSFKKEKIFFTQDTHYKNYLETQEGKNLPVLHCINYSDGWEICDKLKKYTSYLNVYKKETFGSKNLANFLWCVDADNKVDEIEIVGLCTCICVISNALLIKAFLPEVKITVDASCCAGVTPESHKNALQSMKMCQINVVGEDSL